ncbi:hypothetical protein [uncultured Thomasclavelia sp.]|uniref:hypothetical protein n=1 Tax=uncultured Thomasclavelia sp. TaxID=3025759 RepID=UPI0026159E35|nr:hypothetical protein [uncultured Thomasclavelia sp.]
MDMSKELLKVILEAAKEAGAKVEVYEIKSKEDLKNLNINGADEKPFLKADKKYLIVEKTGKDYEVVMAGMNVKEAFCSIGAIIKSLVEEVGIPRAVVLNALIKTVMED